MSDETSSVWAAVDKLTKPTRQKVQRAGDPDWHTTFTDPTAKLCVVAHYRAAFEAATAGYAIIPSLWDQSTIALHGGEIQVGRGSKPLRERSIADLDLMEIRAIIRETVRHHREDWGELGARPDRWAEFTPTEIRHFASTALTRAANPERCGICRSTHTIDFWRYRFESWARLLENYLRAAEHQARPVRLRNSTCPTCRTRQITIDLDGEAVVVPALVIDFRDGYVRAATCAACGDTWFRGDDLERLAADLGVGLLDTPNDAVC